MRVILTRITLITLSVGVFTFVGINSASADTVCQQTNPATGQCLIWVEAPSSPSAPSTPGGGPKDTGSGSACYWDGGKQGVTKPPPGPVPCSSAEGYWSNTYNCYLQAQNPQPPAGDPSWQGHQPGDGAVYQCYQPETDIAIYIWAANPPPGAGTGPTPHDVAEVAIKRMDLTAINIGITPEPGPNRIGLVGMPVWLWAQGPDAHTYGPATASASAGGIMITATARVEQITWDMGDGNQVVCHSAGTPYKASYGEAQSPDCGHVYDKSSSGQPGGKYTVTATSDWVVTWQGAGQSGTIRLNGLARSVQIAVGEAQVLVQ